MLAPVSMHVVLEIYRWRPGAVFILLHCCASEGVLPQVIILSVSESFFHLVGLYLGTHCQGACEADLNWRPANLACRPLNLAHLVE
jgi:hypothetical protein